MSTPADEDLSAQFRVALRGIASTVCVITASDSKRRHGMTVTSVTSLTMEPPALLACINRSTLLLDIGRLAQGFCVNVLCEGQEDISRAFSGGADTNDRFLVGEWSDDEQTGLPYLEDAQSVIFCKKAAALPYGTHMILIGDVTRVFSGDLSRPLIYQNAGYAALVHDPTGN